MRHTIDFLVRCARPRQGRMLLYTFSRIENRLLADSIAACREAACREPTERRFVQKSGGWRLEPATACLEGRWLQEHRTHDKSCRTLFSTLPAKVFTWK